MKKKIIILEHSGGRLGNQLWNFMSIFAYGKEKGYEVLNYSFSDYYSLFQIKPPNLCIKILSIPKIRNNKLFMALRPYRRYITLIKKIFPEKILDSGILKQFYLPPTSPKTEDQKKHISDLEKESVKTFYTINWMFRNPIGLEKYRKDIVKYFRPKEQIENDAQKFIENIRASYPHIVGVHIRQGDYKTFRNTEGNSLYFEQNEIKKILYEYLTFSSKDREKTLFVLCSDGYIDESKFEGLNVKKGLGNIGEDLFTLAKTDCIIGSDSTFGAFASYYGNIPFIIFERPAVDWQYYRSQIQEEKHYFENKKSTVVFY